MKNSSIHFHVLYRGASLLLLFAGTSHADLVVTMNVTGVGSGTYEVLVAVEANDPDNGMNAGIASYSIPLQNVVTVDHVSPNGVDAPNSPFPPFNAIAFGGFDRSGDVQGLSPASHTLTATQDTFSPDAIIAYDMGITGGDLATLAGVTNGFFSDQQVYDAPLLIASGTWSGTVPSFLSDISINLFDPSQDTTTFSADFINSQVVTAAIPEPSAFVFLSLVLVVGWTRRRWALDLGNMTATCS